MIGAPLMTLWLARFPKKTALILLMAIFTIGNVLATVAPDYMSLMGARLITSLNHGAFFGLGSWWWRPVLCLKTNKPVQSP